jgi:polysaccharide biosynthesis/export protein
VLVCSPPTAPALLGSPAETFTVSGRAKLRSRESERSTAMGRRQAFSIAQLTLAICVVTHIPAGAQVLEPVSPAVPGAGVAVPTPAIGGEAAVPADYILGPDDEISIKSLDAEEINHNGIRIDPSGNISLPLVGRVLAGGLTVAVLERELAARLKTYVREPAVAVTVTQYRSQPVTVLGAVGRSGVHQLEGRKRLIEILAMAGGLQADAGNLVKITRKSEWGEIPLPTVRRDPTGQFTVAEVSLSKIMRATSPEENILILPNDIISVPRADIVYVMGEVKKPGGFVLQERSTLSGLQALAMAQGFTPVADSGKAIIIRQSEAAKHVTIQANLSKILSGEQADIELLPDDILLIPKNMTKTALGNVVSTAIRATTSAFIYRGLF